MATVDHVLTQIIVVIVPVVEFTACVWIVFVVTVLVVWCRLPAQPPFFRRCHAQCVSFFCRYLLASYTGSKRSRHFVLAAALWVRRRVSIAIAYWRKKPPINEVSSSQRRWWDCANT